MTKKQALNSLAVEFEMLGWILLEDFLRLIKKKGWENTSCLRDIDPDLVAKNVDCKNIHSARHVVPCGGCRT